MKYSVEQHQYIEAKSKLDAIKNKINQIVKETKLKETCTSRKEYGEKLREIEYKLGYTSALTSFVEAEQKLMEWAHSVVKRDPKYKEHKTDIENLFQKYYFHNDIKDKMIDLALKLELSTNTMEV